MVIIKIRNSLGSAALLVSCVAASVEPLVTLTEEGRAVRVLTPDVVEACEKLGPVSSWKSANDGGLEAAQNDVRNRVARRGGNALVTQIVNVEQPAHAEVIAQAYHCDFPPGGRVGPG